MRILFIGDVVGRSGREAVAASLPKLRDALRDGVHEVKVPPEVADRARLPIERMVAIS